MLAQLYGARAGDPDELEGIEQERVLVVACRAEHVLVFEQPRVDQLSRRARAERGYRPNLIAREARFDLGLARQAQLVTVHLELLAAAG